MEDLEIWFGGKSRRLRLTVADGAALQKRFEFRSAASWLVQDVLGVIPHLATNVAGDLDAQSETLAVAINRGSGNPNNKVSAPQVLDWVGKLMEEISAERQPRDAWKQILWALFRTAHRSGWPQQKPADPEDEQGLKRLFFAERVEDALEPTPETATSSSTPSPSTSVPAEG